MIPIDPIVAAKDALLLLETGRPAMARRVLETLAGAIEVALRDAASEAYLRGQTDTHRMMAAAHERRLKVPRREPAPPPKPNRLDELRAALADPAKRDLVKAALRLDDKLIDRVVEGRAILSGAQRRRVREALR